MLRLQLLSLLKNNKHNRVSVAKLGSLFIADQENFNNITMQAPYG